MLDREPGRDVVDAALVIARWRLAAVVKDHASRRRVGGRHDGGRGKRALLDVARQLLEVDQRRGRLRLRLLSSRLGGAGAREVDVAFALDGLVRRFGGEATPFDTIVLSGPNAALPHGTPGERELGEGDLVVVDLGAVRGGYCADVTRTFSIGEPNGPARAIYEAVERAQEAGRRAVRPGSPCSGIDAAARSVIEDAGYGDLFVHRTGHGLGLEVHEPPSLVAGENRALEAGMVVTVEPGVYVRGFGGVRIEDDVAVVDGGAEVLTTARRDLVACGP